jgi:hypothetical protein
VPEDLHRHARVDVKGRQQRAAGFPRAVHRDLGNACPGDAAVEAAVEVARLDRRAVPGGEDQASVDPDVSRMVTISVLLLLADLKRSDAQVRQRQRCLGCLGLDLAAGELLVHRGAHLVLADHAIGQT